MPNISGLVTELFPNQRAEAPIPEAVVAALKDIQSAQQQQAGALQEGVKVKNRQHPAMSREMDSHFSDTDQPFAENHPRRNAQLRRAGVLILLRRLPVFALDQDQR